MKKITLIGLIWIFFFTSLVNAVITDNLYSYYTMDSKNLTGGILYDELNRNNLTGYNNYASPWPGIVNESVNMKYEDPPNYFKKTGGTNITIASGEPFSASFWVNTSISSPSGNEYIFQIEADANNQIALRLQSGKPRLFLRRAGTICQTESDVSVGDGSFHHVVVLREGNDCDAQINFYIDGNKTTTTSVTNVDLATIDLSNADMHLGVNDDGVDLDFDAFTGLLDEVALWTGKNLTQVEIAQLYNSGNGLAYPLTNQTPSAPVVCSIDSVQNSLVNNTINFNEKELNFTYNASFTTCDNDLFNIDFYVNDVLNMSLINVNGSINNLFNITFPSDYENLVNISYNASKKNSSISKVYYYYNVDLVPPQLVISTDFSNNSNVYVNSVLTLTVTITDDNLFAYNITIFDSNRNVWNNENYFAENLTGITSAQNITSRTLSTIGNFSIFVEAWDSHTMNSVREIKGDYLGIRSRDLIKRDNEYWFYKEDNMTLNKDWLYLPNSKYYGHFVNFKEKKWLDFQNDQGVNVVIKENNDGYTVEWPGRVLFKGIGDLNYNSAEFYYNVASEDTVLLRSIDSNISLIYGVLDMIPWVLLYITFMTLGIWLITRGQIIVGMMLYYISAGLDFWFIQVLYDKLSPIVSSSSIPGMIGMATVMLYLWLIFKLFGIWFYNVKLRTR